MEEKTKMIDISIERKSKVILDDDCILPMKTNNEDTIDLSEIVKKVAEEGDKSE